MPFLPSVPGTASRPWSGRFTCSSVALVFCLACISRVEGQTNSPVPCKDTHGGSSAGATLPRHILGVFPNHNASPCLDPYVPIGAGEKFKIAREDAFDAGAIVVAGMVAGTAQLLNSNRPFGQEASG